MINREPIVESSELYAWDISAYGSEMRGELVTLSVSHDQGHGLRLVRIDPEIALS